MKIGEGMPQRAQVRGIDCFDWQLDTVEIARDREAFSLEFDVKPAAFGLEWLKAWEVLLAQMKQKIKFLFYFKFALNFIYFNEVFCSFSLNQVVRIHRSVSNAGECNKVAERILVDELDNILFRQRRINSHGYCGFERAFVSRTLQTVTANALTTPLITESLG